MARAKRFTQNPGNTAIAYYRYSSSAQKDTSIDQQRKAAIEYAQKHDLTIIKEYAEPAMSGTRYDRPQLQLMLREVVRLRPAYLILWKTDRLSRDQYDGPIIKNALRTAGVKTVYVAEYIPENDEGSAVIMESLYQAMAAQFAIQHAKNVLRGIEFAQENCLYWGRTIFGYKGKPDSKYEIDEEKAPIVRKIYNDYANGVPMKTIVDYLNSSGIKSVRNKDMTINSVHRILTNTSYIGEYHIGDTSIAGGMPRIIDDELFFQVQKMLKKNKRGGERKKYASDDNNTIVDYWLTDKLVCGYCGDHLHGMSGTSKQGNLYYYYSCNNHRKKKDHCSKKNIRKEKLEAYVLFFLSELIQDSTIRLSIAQKCYEYHENQSEDFESCENALKASIADIDKKLNNIMKAIEQGIFNETTSQRMNELEVQKYSLSEEIERTKLRKASKLKLEDVIRYLDVFALDMNDTSSRAVVLDYLIDKIYVYDDKIVITLFYTDDRRTINYEELDDILANRKVIDEILSGETFDIEQNSNPIADTMLKSLIGDNEDFFALGVR